MSVPYIGARISLVSKSEVRYEGVLYNINTQDSTVALQNVKAFGTEGRRKDGPQIPANPEIFEYVIFKGSDIKDLEVCEAAPSTSTFEDPAIVSSQVASDSGNNGVGASASAPQPTTTTTTTTKTTGYAAAAAAGTGDKGRTKAATTKLDAQNGLDDGPLEPPSSRKNFNNDNRRGGRQNNNNYGNRNAWNNNNNMQRFGFNGGNQHQQQRYNNNRYQGNGGNRGGGGNYYGQRQNTNYRRGRGGAMPGTGAHLLSKPTKTVNGGEGAPEDGNDFDFSSMNEKFHKEEELAKLTTTNADIDKGFGDDDVDEAAEANADAADLMEDFVAYDKSSFFDNISCDITDREAGKDTRLFGDEERQLNSETFGAIGLSYRSNSYRRGGGGRGRGRGGYYNNRGRGGYNNNYRGGRGRRQYFNGNQQQQPHQNLNNFGNPRYYNSFGNEGNQQ